MWEAESSTILECLFKRVFLSLNRRSIEQVQEIQQGLMQLEVLTQNEKVLEFFIWKSIYFMGPNYKNSSQIQQLSILGQALSPSTFPQDFPQWDKYYGTFINNIQRQKEFHVHQNNHRQQIAELVGNVYKFLDRVARNQNIRGKERFLNWIQWVNELNAPMITSYKPEAHKSQYMQIPPGVATYGFQCNFLYLMMMFTQPMLLNQEKMELIIRDRADINIIARKQGVFKYFDDIVFSQDNVNTSMELDYNSQKTFSNEIIRHTIIAIHCVSALFQLLYYQIEQLKQLETQGPAAKVHYEKLFCMINAT